MRCLRPALLRVVARFALAVALLATRFRGRLFGLFGSIGDVHVTIEGCVRNGV